MFTVMCVLPYDDNAKHERIYLKVFIQMLVIYGGRVRLCALLLSKTQSITSTAATALDARQYEKLCMAYTMDTIWNVVYVCIGSICQRNMLPLHTQRCQSFFETHIQDI